MTTTTRSAPAHRTTPTPVPRHGRANAAALRTGGLTGAAGLAAVTASVLVAPQVPDHPVLHDAALFAHLAALTLGLGAVLLIDLTGARWVLRRASLADVARLAALAHPAIWLGLAGLVLSGALLHPDPTADLTQAKLAAVVLVCANGGYATRLSRDISLAALVGDRLPRPLLVRAMASGALSQVAWWTAVVVGFLNTRS